MSHEVTEREERDIRLDASRGVLWSVAQTSGTQIINALVFVALARLLGPATLGLVALASVFVALMQVLVVQGFAQALIQREALERAHLDTAFWSGLILGFCLCAATVALAQPLGALLGEPALVPVLRVLSISLIIGAVASVPSAILQRDLAFRRLATRQLLASLAGALAGLGCAFAHYGVWSLVSQSLTQGLVAALALWFAVPWRPHAHFSRRHFGDVFRFGVNTIGINLLNFANRRADDLMVGIVLGPRMLGLYTVAYRLLLVLTGVMTQTINSVAFPVFSRLQKAPQRLRRAYLLATRMSATIAIPVFLGVATLAPLLVGVLFGPEWSPAVHVLQILAFIGILHASIFFNAALLIALGRPSLVLLVRAVNAVINVAAFAIVVHWGITAVALAYVVCGYALAPLPILMTRRVLAFSLGDYANSFLIPLLFGSVVAGGLLALRILSEGHLPPLIALVAFAAVGAGLYSAAIVRYAPLLAADLRPYVVMALDILRLRRGVAARRNASRPAGNLSEAPDTH